MAKIQMHSVRDFGLRPGITSVIGSGGKTTLLARMAQELHALEPAARIALCTTTHIFPFEGVPLIAGGSEEALAEALDGGGIACTGELAESVGAGAVAAAGTRSASERGKVKLGPSTIPMARLAQFADYVLVEADGSKQLPLKAHAAWEPVVPDGNGLTVLVLGAHGFGKPVAEAAHRSELFCERAGCTPDTFATEDLALAVIDREISLGLISPDMIVESADGSFFWLR